MSIFEVQHQPRAQRIIQRALASARMPHAYLFAGSEGVGRELLAKRLAQIVLCAQPIEQPIPESYKADLDGPTGRDACGRCQDCLMVAAGTHPDLHLIYRQLNRQHPDTIVRRQKALFLGVEVIRHFLIDRSAISSNRGRAKVFIVREAHRLNEAAQNSLLKTLEEPPPATVVILITDAVDRLLPTIRSRCQRVPFQGLPGPFVCTQLAQMRPDVDQTVRQYSAAGSGGSLGLALRRLDDGLVDYKRPWGNRLCELATGREAIKELANQLSADAKGLGKLWAERDSDISDTDALRSGLTDLLAVLADFYRDGLARAVGAEVEPINRDQETIIEQLARLGQPGLLKALGHLAETDKLISQNTNIDLTLESLFIRLRRSHRWSVPGRVGRSAARP